MSAYCLVNYAERLSEHIILTENVDQNQHVENTETFLHMSISFSNTIFCTHYSHENNSFLQKMLCTDYSYRNISFLKKIFCTHYSHRNVAFSQKNVGTQYSCLEFFEEFGLT